MAIALRCPHVRKNGAAPRSGFAHITRWFTPMRQVLCFQLADVSTAFTQTAVKGPFASTKLRRKGTKSAAYLSHICASAARNAYSGVAAVIGPACRQVDELSPFWSARFGLRRFLCLLLL